MTPDDIKPRLSPSGALVELQSQAYIVLDTAISMSGIDDNNPGFYLVGVA